MLNIVQTPIKIVTIPTRESVTIYKYNHNTHIWQPVPIIKRVTPTTPIYSCHYPIYDFTSHTIHHPDLIVLHLIRVQLHWIYHHRRQWRRGWTVGRFMQHSSTMRTYQSCSTVQDKREATTPSSSFHLKALLTCVEYQSWNLPIPHTQHRSTCVRANPFRKQTGRAIQQHPISFLKTWTHPREIRVVS